MDKRIEKLLTDAGRMCDSYLNGCSTCPAKSTSFYDPEGDCLIHLLSQKNGATIKLNALDQWILTHPEKKEETKVAITPVAESFSSKLRRFLMAQEQGAENCQALIFSDGHHGAASSRTFQSIAIVEKWAEEHPFMSYWDDFHEKYPNANKKGVVGNSTMCPYRIYHWGTNIVCPIARTESNISCAACWDSPVGIIGTYEQIGENK